MLYWSILGMLFRAASWSISFIFMAKGDSKLFFINELFASVYFLLLNIAGYYFWGLTGIGIAFLVSYIFYFLHMSILSTKLYKIYLEKDVLKILTIQLIFCTAIFIIAINFNNNLRYFLGLPISIICFIYSYKNIDKRIEIGLIIKTFLVKKLKK